MRTGQHHDIGAPAIAVHETGCDFAQHIVFRHRAALHVRFREACEPAAGHDFHVTVSGISIDQVAGVWLTGCRRGRQQRDHAAFAVLRGRFDRRHGADERDLRIGAAQIRQRQRGGGIAGEHDNYRPISRQQLREHCDKPRTQRRFRPIAIGKCGVVGNVDHAPPVSRLTNRAQYRQSAQPGIEDQQRAPWLSHPGPLGDRRRSDLLSCARERR